MKRIMRLFGFSLVRENDLTKLETRLRDKIEERIDLFMNPSADQKVWDMIKKKYPITDQTRKIVGLRGDRVNIPEIMSPSEVTWKKEDEIPVIGLTPFKYYSIKLIPLFDNSDFMLGYDGKRDALFIGNDKIWETV